MGEQTASDKLKLFISYARHDLPAAEGLVSALEAEGFEVKIDRRDLPYGEEWQKELADFIRASDTVVWLVSPDSVGSKWCNWELGEVVRLSKRLVPVCIGPVVPEDLPEALGRIHLLPSSGTYEPEKHQRALVEALNTDRAWIKEAARLADRAREWLARERSSALLLRGPALRSAETWSVRKPKVAQPPPAEVLELLLASKRGAASRQRWAVGGALAVAVFGIGVAAIALWQQRETQRREAQAFTVLAAAAIKDEQYDRAMRLSLRALPQARPVWWGSAGPTAQ
jgi:hypothetical protein